jgi:hypothetical protein
MKAEGDAQLKTGGEYMYSRANPHNAGSGRVLFLCSDVDLMQVSSEA